MTLSIRPFDYSDRDYEAAVALDRLVWPEEAYSAEELKFHDQNRVSGYLCERMMVEEDGRLVAFGTIAEPAGYFEPGKFWLAIAVHPDERQRGVGTALYKHLLSCLGDRPVCKLTSWTRENQTEGMRFLEKHGFQQVMRYPQSELDLTTFDPAPFAAKVHQVEAAGDIEFKTLAQLLAEGTDFKPKLYDAIWEWLQDVPTPAPRTRYPQEVWEKRTFGDPTLLPEGWFIALAGDDYVGITILRRDDEKNLQTGLTAVSRSHRRRGLATALKVKAINYARQHGYLRITTNNEENNPMFQLNLQLGFVPKPAGLDYVKETKK